MVKSIYVESNNLSPLVDWFNTRPEGDCQVWVGAIKSHSNIYMDIIGNDYKLSHWLINKIAVGELHFKLTVLRARLPVGIVSNYAYWE
jgi:hypothetical protein